MQWLRNHRNEVQEKLDKLTAWYDELVNDQSVALPKFGDVTTPNAGVHFPVKPTTSDAATETKISRKESVSLRGQMAKIDQLDMWKGKLLLNVLAGCGDPDSEAWSAWLAEAFSPKATVEALSNSGGSRFAGVDSKLVMSMDKTSTWNVMTPRKRICTCST